MTLADTEIVVLSSTTALVSAVATGAVSVMRIPMLLDALVVLALSLTVSEIQSTTLLAPALWFWCETEGV